MLSDEYPEQVQLVLEHLSQYDYVSPDEAYKHMLKLEYRVLGNEIAELPHNYMYNGSYGASLIDELWSARDTFISA